MLSSPLPQKENPREAPVQKIHPVPSLTIVFRKKELFMYINENMDGYKRYTFPKHNSEKGNGITNYFFVNVVYPGLEKSSSVTVNSMFAMSTLCALKRKPSNKNVHLNYSLLLSNCVTHEHNIYF